MYNFETIRKDNRLLYEYIRGSHLYGLNNEDSDIDTGGLYICNNEELLGLGRNYKPQVSDERHDTTWFEIGEFSRLLTKSNPTIIETLFVPEDKMLVKPSPLLNEFFENRNQFVTKQCFKPFVAYAISQIEKARGLNKKISQPIIERLGPLDFCYTFNKQGSQKLTKWLSERFIKQEYCGLVSIPNMENVFGVYYDWGQHFEKENITLERLLDSYPPSLTKEEILHELEMAKVDNNKRRLEKAEKEYMNYLHYGLLETINNLYDNSGMEGKLSYLSYWFDDNKTSKGYKGIAKENANDITLSSVSKGEKPICYISFNINHYSKHCSEYKSYQDWLKNRNDARYKSNLNKSYDSKNMMHCFRLMQMGLEIAKGDGINIDRTIVGDREFLMDIRNHKFEYDELMEIMNNKKEEMNLAMENSTIPDKVDCELIDKLLLNIRKKSI